MGLPLQVTLGLSQTKIQAALENGYWACDKQAHAITGSLPGNTSFPCNQNEVFHLYGLHLYAMNNFIVYLVGLFIGLVNNLSSLSLVHYWAQPHVRLCVTVPPSVCLLYCSGWHLKGNNLFGSSTRKDGEGIYKIATHLEKTLEQITINRVDVLSCMASLVKFHTWRHLILQLADHFMVVYNIDKQENIPKSLDKYTITILQK